MENFMKAITNTKSIVGIVSGIILILTNFGVQVDNDAVMQIVNLACGIGVAVGVLNKDGMESTEFNK